MERLYHMYEGIHETMNPHVETKWLKNVNKFPRGLKKSRAVGPPCFPLISECNAYRVYLGKFQDIVVGNDLLDIRDL